MVEREKILCFVSDQSRKELESFLTVLQGQGFKKVTRLDFYGGTEEDRVFINRETDYSGIIFVVLENEIDRCFNTIASILHDHIQFGNIKAPIGLVLIGKRLPRDRHDSDERAAMNRLNYGMTEFNAVQMFLNVDAIASYSSMVLANLYHEMARDALELRQNANSSVNTLHLSSPEGPSKNGPVDPVLLEEEEAFYNRCENLTRYLSLPAFRVPVHVGFYSETHMQEFMDIVSNSPAARICPMAFRFVLIRDNGTLSGDFVMMVISDSGTGKKKEYTTRGLVVSYTLRDLRTELEQFGFARVYRKIISLPMNTQFGVRFSGRDAHYFSLA